MIRRAHAADQGAILSIILPVIRAGETYALPNDMSERDAIDYWCATDRETFVAEIDGVIAGTYYLKANQLGGGAHVANCGYMTAERLRGRGIARAMCRHSLDYARLHGYRAMQFNFVVASNTGAIALWQSMGFDVRCRLPAAFSHPTLGYVDALVMFQTLA